MYRQIKYLGLVLVMLLGLYPIAELTRVIVVSGTYYFPDMGAQFIAEVVIMWLLYLSIVPVFLLINNYWMRHSRDHQTQPGRRAVRSQYKSFPDRNRDYIRVNYKSE